MIAAPTVNSIRRRLAVICGGVCILTLFPCTGLAEEAPWHDYVPMDTIRRLAAASSDTGHVAMDEAGPQSENDGGAKAVTAVRPDTVAATTDNPLDYTARMPKSAAPDRRTQSDAALTYFAVFNPSIAPLKRYMVYDQIDDRYVLSTAPSRRTPIVVGSRDETGAGMRRFEAQFPAKLTTEGVRMPSVSPDMTILKVVESGGSELRFTRDEAGGYYVHGDAEGVMQITLIVEAPKDYFDGQILPSKALLGELANHIHARLSETQRQKGRRVGAEIGLSSSLSFKAGIELLIEYFRGFTVGPLKQRSKDPYLDIALGRKGVCRHRALGFLVTARAYGVATRVVYNEAHAFVEVRVPGMGWRRIDLGGVAPSLTIIGGENRVLDRPLADDLPKPDPYRQSYSHILLDRSHADNVPGRPILNGVPRRDGASTQRPDGVPPDSVKTSGSREPVSPEAAGADVALNQALSALRVELRETDKQYVVQRGEQKQHALHGRVLNGKTGQAVADIVVRVFLTNETGAKIPVGETKTKGDGDFSVLMDIPRDTPTASYFIIAEAGMTP